MYYIPIRVLKKTHPSKPPTETREGLAEIGSIDTELGEKQVEAYDATQRVNLRGFMLSWTPKTATISTADDILVYPGNSDLEERYKVLEVHQISRTRKLRLVCEIQGGA